MRTIPVCLFITDFANSLERMTGGINIKANEFMSWFNCKVSYEKLVVESGKMRKVSEAYLVNAEDFTEVETLMAKFLKGRGPYVVVSVRKIRLYELFLDDKSERYYKCKVGFFTLDENAGVVKRKYVQIIVQADDIDLALKSLHKGIKDTLGDYEVAAVVDTDYIDIVE